MGIWITAGVLLLLGILPLGIGIRYHETGFVASVIAGPLKITVFPKEKKAKKEKKKKPDQEKQDAKEKEEKPPQPPAAQPEKEPGAKGGSLTRFLPLVQLALDFLGDFRRKLRVDNLYLRLILAADDPCDLAVNYGRAWTAVGNLLPQLERLFVIKKRDIQVECDFTAEQTSIIARLDFTISFGRLLYLAIYYGIRFLIAYNSMKRKGGGKS